MSSRTRKLFRGVVAIALAGVSSFAGAQVIVNSPPATPSGVFNAFPAQNPRGPTGSAFQVNYPYPGQCLADVAANGALFPGLTACVGGSFSATQRTAGTWADTSTLNPFVALNPVSPAGQLKYQQELLNPPDYTPDTTSFPGADYYEVGLHEAWGTNGLAAAGLFPFPGGTGVPNGVQWTGLRCDNPAGCHCPADASASFKAAWCTGVGGTVPLNGPLFTPIWGIGQINNAGGPVTQVLSALGLFTPGPAAPWSANTYVATWPSISIRGTRDRPVVVKWVNEFPNTHVLCPHPEAADWPCAIDRTFMGVKTSVDPGLTGYALPHNKVNRYGSPQQPDNSWVTHLHGGEIPPGTDGFAEKWYGNAVTAAAYQNLFVNPPFENPSDIVLTRPPGNFDTYTYPMIQEEGLIWFHDHTLGKTHHNVIGGPAGFFPVEEPRKHAGVGTGSGSCSAKAVATGGCLNSNYTWLDPVTQPRNVLGIPVYDFFFAIQDRAFNDDGSINFSNGLGQAFATGDPLLPVGYTNITPGVNPMVHPTWVPEYFGDMAVLNGVLWPKATVVPGQYRIRFANGSDSRCYHLGFSTVQPAVGAQPVFNVAFSVIASDQGYLDKQARTGNIYVCPGERYELLVSFQGMAPGSFVYMVNDAPAPFPAGITPMDPLSPYAHMNTLMRYDVVAATPGTPAVQWCSGRTNNWNAGWVDQTAPYAGTDVANYTQIAGLVLSQGQVAMRKSIQAGQSCMPNTYPLDPNFVRITPPTNAVTGIAFPAGAIVRQMYLNERHDGTTLAPLGMQLNGVPFEYKVTETPKLGTREFWQFVNLTVDAHPMHPHYVSHQIVGRQNFSVTGYTAALCDNAICQPGPSPGNEMQQPVPDVTPFLYGAFAAPFAWESGRKDAVRTPPNQVTTIVADWTQRFVSGVAPTAPGTAGCPRGTTGCAVGVGGNYVYEPLTSGPFVWHCHINSHEDSEMMRTSLVVP